MRRRRGRPHMVNTDAGVVGSGNKFSLGTIFVSHGFLLNIVDFLRCYWGQVQSTVFPGTSVRLRLPFD